MRLNTKTSAIALCGLLAAPIAQAQTTDGWYVEAALTGSWLKDSEGSIFNAPAYPFANPGSTLYQTGHVEAGWGGRIAVGYKSGRFRVEAEIGRTENDSDSYTATSPLQITVPQDGEYDVTRYMVNTYLDFGEGRWRPYAGVGVGMAEVDMYTFAAPAALPNIPPLVLIDDDDTVIAYQLMLGTAYSITPTLSLTAQYRWFETAQALGVDNRNERITREMAGHNLDVGLRWTF